MPSSRSDWVGHERKANHNGRRRSQWEFKARFRRHAFGWKSQPAIQRVKHGFEITTADVRMAYSAAMKAAEALGRAAETTERIRQLVTTAPPVDLVAQVLRHELGSGR